MKVVNLRYVAAAYPLTGRLYEDYSTQADTLLGLIEELDRKYRGFKSMFCDTATGKLRINTMIYYGDKEKVPVAVLDLKQPISEGAKITFW